MKASADYWRERAEANMDAAQDMAAARLKRIGRAYRQAEADLTEQVDKIIGRYAGRMGLSREEAERYLHAPFDENSRAYGYRMTRAEALRKAAQEQAEKLERKLRGEMDAQWSGAASESARRAEKLTAGISFTSPNMGGVRRALDMRWSGASYSQRIWANTRQLAELLDKEITAAFMSGKTNAAIARTVAERFQVSFAQAERLVRTETSYVENQAAIARYADAGCEEVEFLTARDSRTCPVCAGHNGARVKIAEARAGENVPPLHPWCRCTVVAVVEDDIQSQAAYKPLTDYDFDANMQVDVAPEVRAIVDGAGKKVTQDFPALDKYLHAVGFGNTGDVNPATVFLTITSDGRVGQVMALNRRMWSDLDTLNRLVKAETESGGHIHADSVEAIITHEYGHVAYYAAVLKRIGYSGSGTLNRIQIAEFETARSDIDTMIRSAVGKRILSERSADSESELVAEAFSEYYSGNGSKLARTIMKIFRRPID